MSLITQHLKYKGSELITICRNQHGVPESTSLDFYPLHCHKYEISPFLFGETCSSKWFHEDVMIGTYMHTCDTLWGEEGGGSCFLIWSYIHISRKVKALVRLKYRSHFISNKRLLYLETTYIWCWNLFNLSKSCFAITGNRLNTVPRTEINRCVHSRSTFDIKHLSGQLTVLPWKRHTIVGI